MDKETQQGSVSVSFKTDRRNCITPRHFLDSLQVRAKCGTCGVCENVVEAGCTGLASFKTDRRDCVLRHAWTLPGVAAGTKRAWKVWKVWAVCSDRLHWVSELKDRPPQLRHAQALPGVAADLSQVWQGWGVWGGCVETGRARSIPCMRKSTKAVQECMQKAYMQANRPIAPPLFT